MGMRWPTHADLQALAGSNAEPCVSLYLRFLATYSEQMLNARRYGRAVVRATDQLEQLGLSMDAAADWSRRLTDFGRALRGTSTAQHGVGIFLDEHSLHAFKLAAPPSDRIVVADCFSLRELARQVELLATSPLVVDGSEAIVPEKLTLELDPILEAAHYGRIRRLWTREGVVIAGRINRDTGRIVSASGRGGDVLDALAASVLRTGGRVLVVRGQEMPGPGSVAAELR